jgi:hypothetical protein
MTEFAFETDVKSFAFLGEVVAEMVRRFGIGRDEAIGRINNAWEGNDFLGIDVRFHETPDFWANDIYYGADSFWWKYPSDLKPLPYP